VAIQHLKPGSLSKLPITWYTPTHRLYAIGKGSSGAFYAGRKKKPTFLIQGDSQAEIELEAGRLINTSLE
jgi:hypothetical protein